MVDEIDRAQRQEQQTRDRAIQEVLKKDQENEQPDEENGIRYCLDCGLDIPKKRLAARPNSVRCVDCQHIKEQRNRR